jgi:hypothetical protein
VNGQAGQVALAVLGQDKPGQASGVLLDHFPR